jgi:hypothetical protein
MQESTAATPKREEQDENIFEGLTEAQKKFAIDLGTFLAEYPNYQEIAEGLQPRLTKSGVVEFMCKNICYRPDGRMYCC